MSRDVRRMRPMGIADILDETVELYKSSFVVLVGIAAVMYVPSSLLQRYFIGRFTGFAANASPSSGPPMAEIFIFMGIMFMSLIYYIVAAPFVTGALTYAISERYLGRQVTILDSFKRILNISVLGQLLLAILIQGAAISVPIGILYAAIFAGAMMVAVAHATTAVIVFVVVICAIIGLGAMVAAIYLVLRLVLIETSIVVEMKGIGHALTRSWTLMPGSILKCFVLVFLASAVSYLVSAAATVPFQLWITSSAFEGKSPSQILLILNAILGAISDTILAPVLSIATILLYYDIRVRKEGFDLELLASELDAKTREVAAWHGQPLPQEQISVPVTNEQLPPESESDPQ